MTCDCRLGIYEFSHRVLETDVQFQVLKLQDSFMLWVGSTPPHMGNLAVGMCTRFEKNACGSNLMGDPSDSTSTGLAQKLARKSQKQVFVSYNLPTGTDTAMLSLVEKKIVEEMSAYPEKF